MSTGVEQAHKHKLRPEKGRDSINQSPWFGQHWPYIPKIERAALLKGVQHLTITSNSSPVLPATVHVDFSPCEVKLLLDAVQAPELGDADRDVACLSKKLARALKKKPETVTAIFGNQELLQALDRRTQQDVAAFLRDLTRSKRLAKSRTPILLAVNTDPLDESAAALREDRVRSLLLARETYGRHYASMRYPLNFGTEFKKYREDEMELRTEWTNCAGDIATIVWVSDEAFLCGTTEHSDAHNQQYNKPGNLVLGSASKGTLQAYPDHRIVRPIVEKGENATHAMQESQDPWLYTSVVSSDYDATYDRAYTAGFDCVAKVWRVQKSGSSMELLGEWEHDGVVNFVSASKHSSGMVATAADVPTSAIRVYHHQDDADVSSSPYDSYSCSRITDENGNVITTEKWAYYPATMHWGLHPAVQQMLLVGYSPRSLTIDENDIPEDRRDSGELCLWDMETKERWTIASASHQNVFEVLWHPTQPCFVAATSRQKVDADSKTRIRTQIRIFVPDASSKQAFTPVKTLDCTAVDINELTIMYVGVSWRRSLYCLTNLEQAE